MACAFGVSRDDFVDEIKDTRDREMEEKKVTRKKNGKLFGNRSF